MSKPKGKDRTNWLGHAKNRILDSFEYTPSKGADEIIPRNNLAEENEFTLEKIDTLLATGDCYRAFTMLSQKTKKIKNDSKWLLRLARTLFGMGRYQDAINIFKNINSGNRSSEATLELAIAYGSNCDYMTAHTILKKLFETKPSASGLSYWYKTSIENRVRQGRKFLEQGFYEVASRCFDAALIIEPENMTALKYRNKCIKKKD